MEFITDYLSGLVEFMLVATPCALLCMLVSLVAVAIIDALNPETPKDYTDEFY